MSTQIDAEPWTLDDREIHPAAEITLTHDALDISMLASAVGGDGYSADDYGELYGGVAELNVLREFDRAGDLDVKTGYAGRFHTIERSGRDPVDVETAIDPATRHAPPVDLEDWLVADYSESQVGPNLYRVDVSFQRPEPREDAFDPVSPESSTGWGEGGWGEAGWGGLSTSPDTWTFDLRHGAFELDETQVGLLDRDGSTEGGVATLELHLNREEAAAIADSAGYVDAAVERPVPEGLDFAADTHPDGRQSVYVSMHEGFELDSGWYVILGWELELFAVGSTYDPPDTTYSETYGDDYGSEDPRGDDDVWRAVLDVLPAAD